MHSAWADSLMAYLNGRLPPGYFAAIQVHIGSRVEVDVATLERETPTVAGNGPGVALATEVWAPPAPPLVMPGTLPDEIEVQVIGGPTGAHLVAAVELVSPGNKDRPEARRAFAAKCASYLQSGIGVVAVDVVTQRQANLHDELIDLLEQGPSYRFPDGCDVYAVSYRPARRNEGDQIDIWTHPLALGQTLPVVPLALRGGPTLPLDLEATYTEARQRSRL
jgi:hypothetical protein